MNILVIHEVDWINKVIFEPHHLAELLSLKGNDVFVVDCREPNIVNLVDGFHTKIIKNYNRVYENASLTLIQPPALLIKGFNRFTHFLFCKRVIKKIMKEKKIDIVLLYGVATNGKQTIDAAKEFGIPVVFRALDVAHGLVKIPVLRQLAKKYESVVIKNAVKIFTTTPDLKKYAIEMGARKEDVDVFLLGVNFNDFKPLQKDVNLLKQLGLNDNDVIIVFMGTLYDFSGLEQLIQNFEYLEAKIKNIKLLIVGGGPSQKYLTSMIHDKNLCSKVIITGFIPQKEVPKYVGLANICVNPFQLNYITNRIIPTKILEYFACGKPVLSTPLQGTKELLSNEKSGIIYANSEEFIEVLSNLLQDNDKLNELGKKGYQYVKENHDWDKLSDNLILEFKELIK